MRDALREGHVKVALALKAHGGKPGMDEITASGELCELARQGNLELLKVLVACGVPVDPHAGNGHLGRATARHRGLLRG